MRKFADYLTGIERGPVPPEGAEGSDGDPPARAWLQRADTDQDDPHGHAAAAEPGDEWTMTLEQRGGATNHAASFEDLVALAVDSGIDEFHVWSSARRDFEVFTADSVGPLD